MISIKKLEIKCFTIDSINIYKYRIIIYNSNQELVLDDFTTNGSLFFNIPYYDLYKIIVIPQSNLKYNYFCQNVLIHKNFCKILLLPFCKNSISKKTVTLILTDKNYKGLPIKKGEITLWQNHIQ